MLLQDQYGAKPMRQEITGDYVRIKRKGRRYRSKRLLEERLSIALQQQNTVKAPEGVNFLKM